MRRVSPPLDPQFAQFGQLRDFAPPWQEGEARAVIDWYDHPDNAPQVHALLLSLVLPKDIIFTGNTNHQWFWRIATAVGGARAIFMIDAVGVQQICFPANGVGISLVNAKGLETAVYDAPLYPVSAAVYLANGTTATQPATLTQYFQAAPATAAVFPIPPGAWGFRLLGTGDITPGGGSPFMATVRTSIVGATFADTFLGTQLLETHHTEDFIPIAGGGKFISVNNTSPETVQGAIQWCVDF